MNKLKTGSDVQNKTKKLTYSKCYGYTHGSYVLAGTMLTDNEYAIVFIEMFIVTING